MPDEHPGARTTPRRPAARRHAGAARDLVDTIEGEIIPRLMLVHRARPDATAAATSVPGHGRPGPDDVTTLASHLLARDPGPAEASIEALLGRGVSLEAVYLDLVTPAARRLGALWDDDQVDFLQVTLGLARLQQIVQRLGSGVSPDPVALPAARALLASLASDHHTLAVRLVGDLFRGRGWEVTDLPAAWPADIVAAASRESFDLFGLSIACDGGIGQAVGLIAAVRRASRNPAIRVLVGGPAFAGQPGRVAEVGADDTAQDGLEAAARARALLAAAARPIC